MKKVLFGAAVLVLVLAAGPVGAVVEQAAAPADAAAKVVLCGKCGQVKGSDLCCKADAVKCEKCGLVKGSPGCCKMTPGQDCEMGKCGKPKGACACPGGAGKSGDAAKPAGDAPKTCPRNAKAPEAK